MRSKNSIYNILSNLFLQLIVIIYGFIVPKIIIKVFGSNVNGLLSSISQFLSYVCLLEVGIGPVIKSALYKPISSNDKNKIKNILRASEKFFKHIAIIFIIYIFILCLCYPLFTSGEFSTFYTVSLIIIISISTFAEYFFGMTYRLYLQAVQKIYIISIIQIITYVFSIIFVVILAHNGCSIQLIKLISCLMFIARPILQNLYVKKKYKINLKGTDENYKLENKWDGFIQHIAAVIHNNTDITLLTIFCNFIEVSVYSVYHLVVNGIKAIIQSFSSGIDSIFGDMIVKNEIENLNKKFNMYECIYFTICTIVFTSTIILITPFISVYTKNITDANYIRPLFGYLIVISEYIWAIKLPYSSITLAAGHFKQTRIGAWIECISNIVISIIFVKRFGLVGVTIGTIVAMLIRTIEFAIHANKYILNRNAWHSIKKMIIIGLETCMIFIFCQYIQFLSNSNYINWIVNAIVVVAISSFIVIFVNSILYKNDFKQLINILKNLFKRKKVVK